MRSVRTFQRVAWLSLVALLMVTLAPAFMATPQAVDASSHREAPLTSQDPVIDSTDLYMFVSPDRPDTVTIKVLPVDQTSSALAMMFCMKSTLTTKGMPKTIWSSNSVSKL
jgi:predicted S18 family serine protease